MKVKYCGSHPTVYLADDESIGTEMGEDGAPVIRQGVPVEVPDELAVRLLEQSTWVAVPRSPSKAAAPAAPTESASAEPTKGA